MRELAGLDDATQIASGSGHVCGLRKAGQVACWGAATISAMGWGASAPTPVIVDGLTL